MQAMTWLRAAGVAWAAVHGPFVFMATYTLLFVSCSHCKKAAWAVLPFGPGLIPVEAARQWLGLSRPSELLGFSLASFVAIASVFGLAVLVRRGRWARLLSVAVATAVFSFFAFCTLAMIRA